MTQVIPDLLWLYLDVASWKPALSVTTSDFAF